MGYQRSYETKKRLKKLAHKTCCLYGAFYDKYRGRYVRLYRPTSSKKLKQLSNRKVRQTKGHINNGSYRRLFDYWWEMY